MDKSLKEKTVFSFAKINLFLEITAKRDDGYHEIETVIQEIDLADKITFILRQDSGVNLKCNIDSIPCDENNLIVKAAMHLQKHYNCQLGCDIYLEKKIPAGGGLGGGSSNCAATILTLDKLWGLALPETELNEIAAALGSDINFFLYGGTCLCTGRGEEVRRLPGNCEFEMILIFPNWGISTKEAYKNLDSREFGRKQTKGFLKKWETKEKGLITEVLFNRFENSVFNFEKREFALFKKLTEFEFSTVRMSGSGSTLYGILPEKCDSQKLLAKIKAFDGVRDALLAKTKSRKTP